MSMKFEFFTNGTFADKNGNVESVPCRLRGGKDDKTWKIPASAFETIPERNSGVLIEVEGDLKVSGNYVSPENCKVLDVRPGAGEGGSHKESLEDYLASLQKSEPNDMPY